MNQENNNIMDKQQLSEEELQRTQVLNLDDFRSVARIEKLGSKKPAIVVAVIGLFSIVLGTAFPAIQAYNARKEAESNRVISARRDEDEVEITQMTCVAEAPNQANGTDEYIKSTYTFEDGYLQSMEKEYRLTKTDPTADVPFIESYKQAIPPYLVQTSGYSLTIKDTVNGIVNTTKVDYDSLDMTEIPEFNKDNLRFDPEFTEKVTEEIVKTTRESLGFKCK